jgi:Photosynthesis affected mutant 68
MVPQASITFCAIPPLPLRSPHACASTCRTYVVAKTDGPRKTGSGAKRGFGADPPELVPGKEPAVGRVDMEEYVPRGPTMRQDYVDRGLMELERDPNAGVLPQAVADRMLRRIVGFSGVPMATLLAFFGAYFVAKYKYDVSIIPVVVATTTLSCIATAGVGITYGIMSSSWDEDKEGTKLGFTEAKMNVLRARDGLTSMMNKERRDEERAKNLDLSAVNKLRKDNKRRNKKHGK